MARQTDIKYVKESKRERFLIFFLKLADGFIEPRSSPWSQAKLWLYLVLCVWTWVNRIMALRLAFLVCCALTGAGVKLLEAPVGATIVLITSNALVVLVMLLVFFWKETPSAVESPESRLHWNPEIPRRGMGDLIQSVSHIAIIVSDVGRSLAFYTEIIGFQQIQRPSFDRHGAWLTMGNVKLHLIKGVPNAPSGRDLIVSHIALDTNEPHKVLEKLLEYEVPLQNIPSDPQKGENLVEAFKNSDGKIIVRDPDGYYLELCNCDVLTAFCLFKENAKEQKPGYVPKYKKLMDAMLSTYNESGQVKASFPQLLTSHSFACHQAQVSVTCSDRIRLQGAGLTMSHFD